MGINEIIEQELKRQAWEEGLEEGLEKGIEKGLEKGSFETLKTVSRSLISKGFSTDEIAEILELDVKLVRELTEGNPE